MDIKEIFKNLMNLQGENEVVEWKTASNTFDFNTLGKYFSALSNEANLKSKSVAWLVFGVSPNKAIVGTQYRKNRVELDKLKHEVAKESTNGISFIELHDFYEQSNRIIMFEIPAAPRGIPIEWKGHYYARNGESLTALNIEKLERIRTQELNTDWSAKICVGATIDDLDKEAITKARIGFVRKNPSIAEVAVNSWSDEIFLNKAKITILGKITNSAILLLGKPESEHFISPATAKISWILKDQDGVEKDYEHFTCPLIISVDKVYQKIRNLRYRYMSDGSLFPDEIDRYDPITIREAVNNCIAHQDYLLGGKINVVENEDGSLIFTNLGSFIPETVENVIDSNAPPEYYRNKFLANAMVNLNMIDTIGSGIRKMFFSQKEKFFPLPEYDLSSGKVKLTIIGKVLDMQYAKKLAQVPDLKLKIIMALDKVQKRKKLTTYENKELRQRGLIEGKFPNVFISPTVAKRTGEKGDYMRMKGIEDEYAQKMIIDYLEKFSMANRKDLEDMLLDKLPDILDNQQKKDKVKNLLQKLKKEGKIGLFERRKWRLSK